MRRDYQERRNEDDARREFEEEFWAKEATTIRGAFTRHRSDYFGENRGGGEDVGLDAREAVSGTGGEGEAVGEETRGGREGWGGSRGEGFDDGEKADGDAGEEEDN